MKLSESEKLPWRLVTFGAAVGLGTGIITWVKFENFYGGWFIGGHDSFMMYTVVHSAILFGAVLGGFLAVLAKFMSKKDPSLVSMLCMVFKLSIGTLCAMCMSSALSHLVGLASFAMKPVKLCNDLRIYQLVALALLMSFVPLCCWLTEYAQRTILTRHAWRKVALCVFWGAVAAGGTFGMNGVNRLIIASLRNDRLERDAEPDDKPIEHRISCDEPGSVKG